MELLCHRCGTTVVPDDIFCPSCGAPQLRIEEGAEPFNPAQPRQPGSHPLDPSWKDAITAALIFALPVGLFSSNLLPFASAFLWLFVVAGAIAAVNLYQRRAAASLLNTRVGLRIGMMLGVTAALLSTTADGLLMVAQRYILHKGAVPDREVQGMVDIFIQSSAQNPQAQVQFHDLFAALGTPDGKAALVLFTSFSSAVGIFVLSIIGGALGAKIFSIRRIGVKNL